MAGFRKRTYGGRSSGGPAKRRRVIGRARRSRGRARGKKSFTITTQSGKGGSLRFKSKKISKRAWNRKLWDATLQKAHYRSAGGSSGTLVTTVSNLTWQLNTEQAMDNGSGPFWTSAGGTQVLDAGIAVATFQDDIILRGGKVGVTLYNDSTTNPVEIWMFLIKTAPRPSAGLASLPANPPVGWDVTMFNEFFKDIGRVVYSNHFLLEANAVGEGEVRIPIQKIDQESWATDQERYWWISLVKDFDPVDQVTVRIITYFNLSFSADSK